MKTIGMIGGLSYHSSLQMYQYINDYIAKKLGEYNCAQMVLVNVNLQDVFVNKKDKQEIVLLEAAKKIDAANCDFYIICSNTMHKHSDFLNKNVKTPMLHIADATSDEILSKGIKKIGLMGTRITMEEEFYKGRLEKNGLEVLIPSLDDRKFIDKVLYEETGFGIIKDYSSKRFYDVGQSLVNQGAEGIILGCTEIGLLMQQKQTDIPLFDTTIIHGQKAAKLALKD